MIRLSFSHYSGIIINTDSTNNIIQYPLYKTNIQKYTTHSLALKAPAFRPRNAAVRKPRHPMLARRSHHQPRRPGHSPLSPNRKTRTRNPLRLQFRRHRHPASGGGREGIQGIEGRQFIRAELFTSITSQEIIVKGGCGGPKLLRVY